MIPVWERTNFYFSPSISSSLNEALRVSGLKKDDIDLYDFYSYVPVWVLHSTANKIDASPSSPNWPHTTSTCLSRTRPGR